MAVTLFQVQRPKLRTKDVRYGFLAVPLFHSCGGGDKRRKAIFDF
jgi:hypothetical protein